MSLKITKLSVLDQVHPKTKKKLKNPSFFELHLEFEIKNKSKKEVWDNHHNFFDQFLNWYQIMSVDDPKKYELETKQALKKHNNDITKALQENFKQRWKKVWVSGSGMLVRKGNKYTYQEYFTYTPVTKAILSELKKMQKDPDHSFRVVPEQYLSSLIRSLSLFWD